MTDCVFEDGYKLPNSREEAIETLGRKLDNIKKLRHDDGIMDNSIYSTITTRARQSETGRLLWIIVTKFDLLDELKGFKRRDFVLAHAPPDIAIVNAKSLRQLFKISAIAHNFALIFELMDRGICKEKDISLLLARCLPSDRELINRLTTMYPKMGKVETKMIVSSWRLLQPFYPTVVHFGSRLYHWAPANQFSSLVELGCEPDLAAFERAFSLGVGVATVRHMLRLFGPITQELYDVAVKDYRYLHVATLSQISELTARYYSAWRSVNGSAHLKAAIFGWLGALKTDNPRLKLASDSKTKKHVAEAWSCIQLVEPDIAAQLLADGYHN